MNHYVSYYRDEGRPQQRKAWVDAGHDYYWYLLRQTFLLILSLFRSTDLFGGAGTGAMTLLILAG